MGISFADFHILGKRHVCVCIYVEICFGESNHPLLVKFVKAHALSYHKTLQWYMMEERNGISPAV